MKYGEVYRHRRVRGLTVMTLRPDTEHPDAHHVSDIWRVLVLQPLTGFGAQDGLDRLAMHNDDWERLDAE